MHRQLRMNDSVHLFMNELTARLIAESGIPSDRFHLGKIILQSLKDAPEFISQIDAATGEEESNGSVLERSVRCARALQGAGLRYGDVVVLMAPNHRHLCIPIYAALYLGLIIAPIDADLTGNELKEIFETTELSMIFCQSNKVKNVFEAHSKLNLKFKVVTFDRCDDENILNFSDLLANSQDIPVESFKATDFDPDETISFIIPTSGTTGLPKQATLSHKNMVVAMPYKWSRSWQFPTPTRLALLPSPLQWISGIFQYILSPVMRYSRLQTSNPLNKEHLLEIITKYKPTYLNASPFMMTSLIHFNTSQEKSESCDLSCFEIIFVGGSQVTDQLLEHVKKVAPNADIMATYGATEVATFFVFQSDSAPPAGSYGKRVGLFNYRLVDPETGLDINEPNIPGELWLKSPSVFKGYFKNPKATADVFAEDEWLKTGDLFYRDEDWNFYFVDRIKMLINYGDYRISPAELESVIMRHAGVLEAGVAGVRDEARGELPAACVVPRPGANVTEHDIMNFVKESLTDPKQLRGGVFFVDKLPMTASSKIDRKRLKEIILQMRE